MIYMSAFPRMNVRYHNGMCVKIYVVARIKRIQESRFHKMISIHFLRRVIARELSFIFHVPNVMTRICYLSKK